MPRRKANWLFILIWIFISKVYFESRKKVVVTKCNVRAVRMVVDEIPAELIKAVVWHMQMVIVMMQKHFFGEVPSFVSEGSLAEISWESRSSFLKWLFSFRNEIHHKKTRSCPRKPSPSPFRLTLLSWTLFGIRWGLVTSLFQLVFVFGV